MDAEGRATQEIKPRVCLDLISGSLVEKFDIRGIPTVLYFKNSKLVGKQRGLGAAQDFKQLIDANI